MLRMRLTDVQLQLLKRESDREEECPERKNGQCRLVSAELGWSHRLPIDTCDGCWKSGGPARGAAARALAVEHTLSVFKKPERLRRAHPDVIQAITTKHMTPAESAAVLADGEVKLGLTRKERWEAVKHTWEQAADFLKSMKSRGLTHQRVHLSIKGERHVSCFGTTLEGARVAPACPSLSTSADGAHHFCDDCGCGDRSLAWLDGEEYDKLDYPYLACPRHMPGFSNAANLLATFDRVACVNLRRRPERWERFTQNVMQVGWPFRKPERFDAVDGTVLPVPAHWTDGGGAYGCLQSHRQILERAIADGVQTLLVLEDDAHFPPNFTARTINFLASVPDDWDVLMLGGQHIGGEVNTPTPVAPGILRCKNCQRTHAYAIRGRAMRDLYAKWSSWEKAWPSGHADHIMGPFLAGYNTYAPEQFLVAQHAGPSDINGKDNPEQWWNPPQDSLAVVWFRSPLIPDPDALRKKGFHLGYRQHPNGAQLGLMAALTSGDSFKDWYNLVRWEAAALPCAVGIWVPPKYEAKLEPLLREAAGENLRECRS